MSYLHTDVFFGLVLLPVIGAALYGVAELALQRWPVAAGVAVSLGVVYRLGAEHPVLAVALVTAVGLRAAWLRTRPGRAEGLHRPQSLFRRRRPRRRQPLPARRPQWTSGATAGSGRSTTG